MSKQKFRLMQTFMEIPLSLKNELSQITNSLDLLKAGLVGAVSLFFMLLSAA